MLGFPSNGPSQWEMFGFKSLNPSRSRLVRRDTFYKVEVKSKFDELRPSRRWLIAAGLWV